jgi:hypothetical protein
LLEDLSDFWLTDFFQLRRQEAQEKIAKAETEVNFKPITVHHHPLVFSDFQIGYIIAVLADDTDKQGDIFWMAKITKLYPKKNTFSLQYFNHDKSKFFIYFSLILFIEQNKYKLGKCSGRVKIDEVLSVWKRADLVFTQQKMLRKITQSTIEKLIQARK